LRSSSDVALVHNLVLTGKHQSTRTQLQIARRSTYAGPFADHGAIGGK